MKFRIKYDDGYYFSEYRKWGTWWFIKNSYSKNIERARNACKDFLTGDNEPKIIEKFELKAKF